MKPRVSVSRREHVTRRAVSFQLARKKATEGAKPPALDCTETRARRCEVTTADAAAWWHLLPTAEASTAIVVSTGSALVAAFARAMKLTTTASANASEFNVCNVETPVRRHCKVKLLNPSGNAVQCVATSVIHLLTGAALRSPSLTCGTSAHSTGTHCPASCVARVARVLSQEHLPH